MTEQLAIDGDARTLVDGKPLTDRQQLVWNLVRHAYDGVSADEAGAAVHAFNGKHDADDRCEWCATTGKSVLRSVPLRKLAIRRKDGRWRPRDPKDQLGAGSAQIDSDDGIPW
jgi:hypothetical protein